MTVSNPKRGETLHPDEAQSSLCWRDGEAAAGGAHVCFRFTVTLLYGSPHPDFRMQRYTCVIFTDARVELEGRSCERVIFAMKCLSFMSRAAFLVSPACMNTSVREREEEQSAVANSAFGKSINAVFEIHVAYCIDLYLEQWF